MTSLLQDKLYEIQSQAPSPSKDFHHFTITKTEVIWRSWRISFRPNQEKLFPEEVRKLHSDFLLNEQLHKQVQNIFRYKMLEYTLNLCQGCYDFLTRMPDNLIMHILSFLNADDIRQLSKTCKKFQQVFPVISHSCWPLPGPPQDAEACVCKQLHGGCYGEDYLAKTPLHNPIFLQVMEAPLSLPEVGPSCCCQNLRPLG
ncbi:F-box only protein 36-like [Pangshura tecta]